MDREFDSARALAIWFRDQIDNYAGQQLSDEFVQEIKQLVNSPKYRKMIYKGVEFSSTFRVVLRDYRLEILKTAISS